METISLYRYNVTLWWHFIDSKELYQMHKAIQALNDDPVVDMIMLFDYDLVLLRFPDLLDTKNKTIIRWGERNTPAIEIINTNITDEYQCGEEHIVSSVDDEPYCKMDLNVTFDGMIRDIRTITTPRAMLSLVQTVGWTSLVLLHENSTEIEASEMLDLLSAEKILSAKYNIDLGGDIHDVINKTYEQSVLLSRDMNVLVMCSFACTRKILQEANQFDSKNSSKKTLLKKFSKWLIVIYGHTKGESRALEACADDLDNVAILAIPAFSGVGKEVFLSELDDLLLTVYRQEALGQLKDDVESIVAKQLAKKAAPWEPSNRCLGYNIDTLLWAAEGRQFRPVGHFDYMGTVELHSKVFPNVDHGFNGREFLVSTIEYPPFVIKRQDINGTVIYEGFCIDLLIELSRTLNFTYVLTEPPDQAFGGFIDKEKGLFAGLVGQLQREEVDMTTAPLSEQADRAKVIDYSYPFYYEFSTIVIKKPDVDVGKWRTLVDPFKWQVLVSIIVALIAVTTITFLLEKHNPFYLEPGNALERMQSGGLHTWHDAFWYMYGALLCQGGVHLPASITGRTMVSSWWLFCIVVVGTYSGNLIAFFTVTKETAPFNTLEELVDLKGTYKWGTLGMSVWDLNFMSSKTEPYISIDKGMREFSNSDSTILHLDPTFHMRRVLQDDNYAFITDTTTIEVYKSQDCRYISIQEEFMPMKYGLGFPKKSPHTTFFSKQLQKITESGLFQIWKRKWWPKANFCAKKYVTEEKAVTLADVQSSFYVCVIGIFVGLVVFFIELCVFRFNVCKGKNRGRLGSSADLHVIDRGHHRQDGLFKENKRTY
ncbi:glutamate receptor 3-like [Mya arenaria]|uniref:glutamate receptor 3-like n=1 Tax=Mya arenaria TaxID=6604 RepID=UPI0022E61C1E|nr:glutamate receptor 3-like [Mya arenaria]